MTDNDPIWKEDVEKEVEYLKEGARTISAFYHRVKGQGAPEVLLQSLAEIYSLQDQAYKKLGQLTQCFPEEPRWTSQR